MPKSLSKKRKRTALTRNALALRGLALVVVLLLLAGLFDLRQSGKLGGPPEVTAFLRNAGGSLAKGSDVKMHGVIVGRVNAIKAGPDGSGVRVEMAMDDDVLGDVPRDSVARILPATVFGTSYVDLRAVRPHATDQAMLKDGDTIQADADHKTLELQDALDDIDGLVKAIGPAKLSNTLGAAAVALDGRGHQLGDMARGLDDYLHKFNPQIHLLQADLAKLSQFLQLVQRIAPDLLDATDHGLVALKALVAHRDDLEALLKSGTRLSDTGRELLAKNDAQLRRFIHDAYRVIDAVYDNRKVGISGAIKANSMIGDIVQRAVEKGYIKTDGHLQGDIPPYYGPGDRPHYGGAR